MGYRQLLAPSSLPAFVAVCLKAAGGDTVNFPKKNPLKPKPRGSYSSGGEPEHPLKRGGYEQMATIACRAVSQIIHNGVYAQYMIYCIFVVFRCCWRLKENGLQT